MKFDEVKPGTWIYDADEHFYTVYLIKSVNNNVAQCIKVTNKKGGGFELEVRPTIISNVDKLYSIDEKTKHHFYQWLFEWILDTKQKRDITT